MVCNEQSRIHTCFTLHESVCTRTYFWCDVFPCAFIPADLLLLLWPVFFVATTQQDPQLKARTFKKSVVRGAERAAGITKIVARPGPMRRPSQVEMGDTSGVASLEEGEAQGSREEGQSSDRPSFDRQVRIVAIF